jgi:hypothetical protein
VYLRSVLQLLVTANVVPSSSILSTPMMEAIRSSETSVLTRATQRHTPEDGILHSYFCENLKTYRYIKYRQLYILPGINHEVFIASTGRCRDNSVRLVYRDRRDSVVCKTDNA